MRNLRTIRVFVTTLMLAAAIGYMALHPTINPVLQLSDYAQIVPSRITWSRGIAAISLGAALFWLGLTFLYGRIYCSSVCPVGTIQDFIISVRRKLGYKKKYTFRYKRPSRWRWHFLIIYLICLLAGIGIVTLLLEPWRMFGAMAAVVRPADMSFVWEELGWGMIGGLVAGIVSLVLVVVYSLFWGRDFCNVVCPIGAILGSLSERAMTQIRFDPDRCISCMKCEEVCKASCIKVSTRTVDNSRCIRCFDCIDVCPNEAIRFDGERRRPASPLMTKSQ